MFLLILLRSLCKRFCLSNLNSIMFLLILKLTKLNMNHSNQFKFHYVSINSLSRRLKHLQDFADLNSIMFLLILLSLLLQVGKHPNLNSIMFLLILQATDQSSYVLILHLNSIMFLLILGAVARGVSDLL